MNGNLVFSSLFVFRVCMLLTEAAY